MLFAEKKKLRPGSLYGACIGLVESQENRFIRKAVIKGASVLEHGRIYYDQLFKRFLVIQYPGFDTHAKNQKGVPLSTIKESVEKELRQLPTLSTPPLLFMPITENKFSRRHFIAAWQVGKNTFIEDSMAGKSKAYPMRGVKTLLHPSKPSVIYRGWQNGNWECGYYTYCLLKRLLSNSTKLDKPKIDDNLFSEMQVKLEVYRELNPKSYEDPSDVIVMDDLDELFEPEDFDSQLLYGEGEGEVEFSISSTKPLSKVAPKHVALLDVDHTAGFFDGDGNIHVNKVLVKALKEKDIKDIYLFTDMILKKSDLESRPKLIKALEAEGFNVLGVITPNDYCWNRGHRKLLKSFSEEFFAFSKESGIDLRYNKNLDKVSAFFEQEKYEKYKVFLDLNPSELPDLGLAFQETYAETKYDKEGSVETFPETVEEDSQNIKLLTDVVTVVKGLPRGKSLMFEQFFAKCPSSVESVIFFDDKKENIIACEAAVSKRDPKMSVSAYHVRDASYQTMRLSADTSVSYQDYLYAIETHQKGKQDDVIVESKYISDYLINQSMTATEQKYFKEYISTSEEITTLDMLCHKAHEYARGRFLLEKIKIKYSTTDNFDTFLSKQNLFEFKYSFECLAVAALLYDKDTQRDGDKTEPYLAKAKLFLDTKKALIEILENAKTRSINTIDYLNKNSQSPTFMDLTKANKLVKSEEKLYALNTIISHIQNNAFDEDKLSKIRASLLKGKGIDGLWKNMGQRCPSEVLHQARGFIRPQVVRDLEKYSKNLTEIGIANGVVNRL